LTLGVATKLPIEILSSKKAIEVRPKGVNKGSILKQLLAHQCDVQSSEPGATENQPFDFVLCIGDDRTDEDMFIALQDSDHTYPEHHYTVVVEDKSSEARYSIRHQSDVLSLLEYLVASPRLS